MDAAASAAVGQECVIAVFTDPGLAASEALAQLCFDRDDGEAPLLPGARGCVVVRAMWHVKKHEELSPGQHLLRPSRKRFVAQAFACCEILEPCNLERQPVGDFSLHVV